MARVTHFEIHAANTGTLIAFYTQLFGWKFQPWGNGSYWLIETGPSAEAGINGGLVPRHGASPSEGAAVNAYVCTVHVQSVDEAMSKAFALGGTLALPKMAVPTVGWLAYVKDPDGNILGLMQTDPGAK